MSLKHMQDLIEVAKKWRDEGKTRFHATGHSPEKIMRDMRRQENYAKGLTAHGKPRKTPLQTTGRAAITPNDPSSPAAQGHQETKTHPTEC